MTLVTLKDVSLGHGATPVLRNVNLSVDPGEIVTIVGPNGSGKSTLLKGIVGSIHPMSGSITLQKGISLGYVPQKLHIDPVLPLTVERFLRLAGGTTAQQAHDALRETAIEALAGQQMTELSGGQLQRVLLARALLNNPALLLLDEATQGLDQPGSARFYQMIADLRDKTGCAVLMISHELHVVMAASDRVICLNGHICCEGAPEHVASAPEYRALFGSGTQGALALYRHEHNHHHHDDHTHHDGCAHDA